VLEVLTDAKVSIAIGEKVKKKNKKTELPKPKMEMLLYIFGNWCCILAGIILLYHYYLKKDGGRKSQGELNAFGGGGGYSNGYSNGGGFNTGGNFDSGDSDSPQKDIMISRDLQIMLMIGTFARVYWSCSPPPVWSEEETFIQYLSITDVFVSPVLWTAIVYLIGLKQKKYLEAPPQYSWP